ncbi:MAG: aldose epimerase, partial [Mycobacteriales bacterium]
MEPPSGIQHVLRLGDAEAIVTEVGGGLRVFRVGDIDVLEPFPLDAMCDGAHGQTLLPWPNRVADGTWSWDGEDHQLPLTEPDRRTA